MLYGAVVRIAIFTLLAVVSACGSTERAAPEPQNSNPEPEQPTEPDSPTLERVTFAASDGLTLVASLRRGERGAPALILVHQLSSNRGEWTPIIEAMPSELTILAIDMRGHGESVDRNGQAVGWRAFATADWEHVVDDVGRAITYLQEQVSPQRIVLGGSSIGSSAVLLAAHTHANVAGVFALSPGRAYRGLDTITAAPELQDRALLFVAAEGEAPAKDAAEELARLSGGRAFIVGGNAHGVRMIGAAPNLPAQLSAFVSSALETPRAEEPSAGEDTP